VATYSESVILRLNRDFDIAERNSAMPKMFNGLTMEKIKNKISTALSEYFDEIIREREKKLKGL
jgi:hypothetical protein